MAERLLKDHGGPVGLASARVEDLARRPGMGPALSASVVAACQLAVRIRAEHERIPVIRSVPDVADVAIPLLRSVRTERVVAFVVDASGHVRRAITMSDDGPTSSPTVVRDLLAAALHHGGAGIAVASNHPDGDPNPTELDRVLAGGVHAGASSVGLAFLGHVVVAGRLWDEVPVRARPGPAG
jgi:DNA repair protein RadC